MHGCKQFLVFNEAYIERIPLIITLFTCCAIVRCSRSDTGMSQLFLMNVQSMVTVFGQVLEKVESYKYLGVLINSTLTWSDHISRVCSKAR